MKTIEYEFSEFPFCCALEVIGEFEIYDPEERENFDYDEKLSKREIDNFVKTHTFDTGTLLTIPDRKEWNYIRKAFRAAGFRRIGRPVKSNHGAYTVALYQYLPPKIK